MKLESVIGQKTGKEDRRRPLCCTCWWPLGCKSHAFQISRDADLTSYCEAIAQIACEAFRAEIAKGAGISAPTQKHTGVALPLLLDIHQERQNTTEITFEMKYKMKWHQSSGACQRFQGSTTPPPRHTTPCFPYPMHLPSDNRNTLCSSKVRAIRSTQSPTDKTANVKMVKKRPLLSTYRLSDFPGRPTADEVLTGPAVSGLWD